MNTKYRIGYIDEDINQVKKFTRNLRPYGFTVIGYEFTKNMAPESLMQQVYDSEIDLLMIDYKLKETNIVGFNGDVIENLIYNTKPLFPHIIFTSDTDQAEAHVEDWKIIFDKENIFIEGEEDVSQLNSERFVNMLIHSIEQYKKYVSTRKEALSSLLNKGKEEGLNVLEKNEILAIQSELNNLDKSKKDEIPRQLISVDILDSLAQNRLAAEKFLKSLIDKSNESKGDFTI